MAREIKFRAWDKIKKEMCDIKGIDFIQDMVLCFPITKRSASAGRWRDIHSFELMQYTGLRDKNGVEIYEGDIVKYTFDNPDSVCASENGLKIRTGKVFWQEWRSAFALGSKMANNDLFNYVRNGNRVEVIGYIHEQDK